MTVPLKIVQRNDIDCVIYLQWNYFKFLSYPDSLDVDFNLLKTLCTVKNYVSIPCRNIALENIAL